MTQRLPIPGQDDGTWGDILNGFLQVSLDANGNLLPAAVTTAATGNFAPLTSGKVPSTNLGTGTASNSNFLRGDGTWAVPNSGSSALANDTDVVITSPSNNQALIYDSTASKWINAQITESDISGLTADLGAKANISSLATVATSGSYTDLSNKPSIASLDSTSSDIQPLGVQAAGSNSQAAKADHVHAMPRLDQVNAPTASVALNSQKITGLANGAASTDAAAFGQIPTALPPNGSASGDLSGTYPSPNVAKINGTALSGLATGLLKNTTSTGVPSIAVAGTDYLTPTGSGASLTGITESQVTNLTTDLAAKAPLASPTFTGTATAPNLTATTKTVTPALQVTTGAGTANQVLTSDVSGNATWANPTAAPVSSVFTRTGAVVAASGDYTAAQVTNAADKSSASAQTFTGNVSTPAVVVTGLTGATATSRYVGATASGAPASGTFAVGDFVIDQTAKIWVCTTAGSPGTWTNLTASDLKSSNNLSDVASASTARTNISAAGTANIQVFTSSGTWTMPAGATAVIVTAIGGGGGGGSGYRGASGTACVGGGGGASGALATLTLQASQLTSSVTVTIGTGGTGGLAVTTDNTVGNTGGLGTATSFGIYCAAGNNGAGGGVGGGAASGGTGGSPSGNAGTTIGIGGSGASTTGAVGVSGLYGAVTASGASGGGITTGGVASAGGYGSYASTAKASATVATAGTLGGGTGGNGTSSAYNMGGNSGAGGGSSVTGAGGAGGNGGNYGAGGGGGGASLNGNASGGGGNGGNGICVVTTYF